MCGFCGILQDRGYVDRGLITKMRDKMNHRGPDEGMNYIDSNIGLGFRCLKIIDLFSGSQPMNNEDGSLCLVFNGKIYNYKDLRDKLEERGHKFKTKNDCEVILHLYEDKGVDCLQSLRGMFAFALWDKKQNTLFGARDRFGIKPFYYMQKEGALSFASEIKALNELPFFSREVDESAFIDYLTFQYVPEPRTMFSNIYRLPPAHFFLKSPGKPIKIRKYWEVNFTSSDKSLSQFVEDINEKLREAILLHLASDAPRGAFLSGGVDSAIIAALIKEQEPIPTFSVGYAEENYSELQEARETAKFLDTDHYEYIITPQEFIQHLPKLVWHFDEPVADPAAISLYFVARMASQKVKVVLSGEGADEVFAGYGIYREPSTLFPTYKLPIFLQHSIRQVEKILPRGVPGRNYLARSRRPLEQRFLGNAYIFNSDDKVDITNLQNNPSPFRITEPLYREIAYLDEIARMQYIDLKTWMPGDILIKADRMTMANSMELRVPFLDHHVFELAQTIPKKYKICGKTTKKALRESFKDILPPTAINRPKRGFPVPTREWMKRKDFQKLFMLLLNEKGGDWFNRLAVRKMFSLHIENKADVSRKLWTILIFLLWHHIFIAQNSSDMLIQKVV